MWAPSFPTEPASCRDTRIDILHEDDFGSRNAWTRCHLYGRSATGSSLPAAVLVSRGARQAARSHATLSPAAGAGLFAAIPDGRLARDPSANHQGARVREFFRPPHLSTIGSLLLVAHAGSQGFFRSSALAPQSHLSMARAKAKATLHVIFLSEGLERGHGKRGDGSSPLPQPCSSVDEHRIHHVTVGQGDTSAGRQAEQIVYSDFPLGRRDPWLRQSRSNAHVIPIRARVRNGSDPARRCRT